MAYRLGIAVVAAALVGCGTDPSDSMEPTSSGSTSDPSGGTTTDEPPGSESGPTSEDTTSDTGGSSTTGDGGSDGSSDGGSSSSDSSGAGDSSSSGSTGGGGQLQCDADGTLTISVSGEDQADEGHLVWLSAVQPDGVGTPLIVVRLEDTIEGGAFELECVDGLDMNFAYPSWAVVIDADDDGECSDGDVAFAHQLFGWADDQNFAFEGSTLISYETEPPWTVSKDAWTSVAGQQGFDGSPFCSYYLP